MKPLFPLLSIIAFVQARPRLSTEGRYFQDPEDCNFFYKQLCGGSLEHIRCPDQLVFDPLLNACNSPESAKSCREVTQQGTSLYQQVESDQVAFEDDPCDYQIVCPDDPEDQFLPNPEDCTSFYQCSNGLPILQPCPEGLVFDPALNVCNTPEDAPACHPLDCNGHPSRQIFAFGKEPKVCRRHVCPSTGESLVPDPYNCHAYFECSDGLGLVKRCQNRKDVFDPEDQKCVSPDSYDCKVSCHRE